MVSLGTLKNALDEARRKAREVGGRHGRGSLEYAQACQLWCDAQVAFNRCRRELRYIPVDDGSGNMDLGNGVPGAGQLEV